MPTFHLVFQLHQFSPPMPNLLAVASIITRSQVSYHIYADDTQLYVTFDPKSPEDAASAQLRLTQCIAEVRSWMLANKLRLNDSKTELLFASPWHAEAVSHLDIHLKIGGSVITPSSSIKNLGTTFDSSLSMKLHVNALCRSINFHLRNLCRIRRFIDSTTCAHAARSLILSRLDYGNSLLGGLSKSDLLRLQRLQNRAACLIFLADKHASATPFIRELHWLPVQQRIDFNILVHVYNCLHETSPRYLQDLVCLHIPGRAGLRSSVNTTRLEITFSKKTYGDRFFSVLGPKLWNSLPVHIREAPNVKLFKNLLKTHLFPKG